ncbi:glycosyltransferase [Dysgonomonas sp. 521]|uniref:glycosyltransferase family 2 protein n=1 Tax=Dysgonomonas sp. 521 TaxID=2302932 RepID=UPI0013D40F01|nr:glycosyltransferase family 2 protein [Dysgonomonas sp. 521]NDV94430.1 glycosyltransferase [Dysgonomonas sp. 521]
MINYSIIIPHLNIPQLLQRCLDSIPRRKDVQIIVVDDNSDPAIVDFEKFPGLNDASVELVFSKEVDKGAGYARNIGMEKAIGKWVLFADADDYFVANMLDILDSYKDEDMDICIFRPGSKEPVTKKRILGYNIYLDAYFSGDITERDVASLYPVPWSKMVSRDFLLKENIKFEEVLFSNDILWSTKVAVFAQKIICSDTILYIVTARNGSLTTIRTREALQTRFEVSLRRNLYVRSIGEIEHEAPIMHSWLIPTMQTDVFLFFSILAKILKKGMIHSGKRKREILYKMDKRFNRHFYKHPYLYIISVFLFARPWKVLKKYCRPNIGG